MIIGKTRVEAVDWVQERLNYVSRTLAEDTFRLLLKNGLLIEKDSMINATKDISDEEMRQTSVQSNIIRNNQNRPRRSTGVSGVFKPHGQSHSNKHQVIINNTHQTSRRTNNANLNKKISKQKNQTTQTAASEVDSSDD